MATWRLLPERLGHTRDLDPAPDCRRILVDAMTQMDFASRRCTHRVLVRRFAGDYFADWPSCASAFRTPA